MEISIRYIGDTAERVEIQWRLEMVAGSWLDGWRGNWRLGAARMMLRNRHPSQ